MWSLYFVVLLFFSTRSCCMKIIRGADNRRALQQQPKKKKNRWACCCVLCDVIGITNVPFSYSLFSYNFWITRKWRLRIENPNSFFSITIFFVVDVPFRTFPICPLIAFSNMAPSNTAGPTAPTKQSDIFRLFSSTRGEGIYINCGEIEEEEEGERERDRQVRCSAPGVNTQWRLEQVLLLLVLNCL